MRNRIVRNFSLVAALLLLVTGVHGYIYAQSDTDEACFNETEFCISGRIRAFWEQNGQGPVFGAPISPLQEEPVEGTLRQVQWFARGRLELHPDHDPPFDVQVSRLGVSALFQQGRDWFAEFPAVEPQEGCLFFEETGHNLCGEFREVWETRGIALDDEPEVSRDESIALFGLPLSEAHSETLPNGQEYTVQWFERVRLELRPDHGPDANIQGNVHLGLLGEQILSTDEPYDPPPPPSIINTGEELVVFQSDRGGSYDIYLVNGDGNGLIQLTNDPSDNVAPDISPDRTRLAFQSDRDGNAEIYVMNLDGSGLTRLTSNDALDAAPAWSPDGTKIAFYSNRDNNNEIYVMDADGSNQTRLTNDDLLDMFPSWSPDGSKIAFQSFRDGNYEIYVMNADGTNPVNLTNSPGIDELPAWSPDGSRIAFDTARDGNFEIYVMDANGSNQINITRFPSNDGGVSWSADGSRLSFYSDRTGNFDIHVMNVDGSGERLLVSGPTIDAFADWGPSEEMISETLLPGESEPDPNIDNTTELSPTAGAEGDTEPSPVTEPEIAVTPDNTTEVTPTAESETVPSAEATEPPEATPTAEATSELSPTLTTEVTPQLSPTPTAVTVPAQESVPESSPTEEPRPSPTLPSLMQKPVVLPVFNTTPDRTIE